MSDEASNAELETEVTALAASLLGAREDDLAPDAGFDGFAVWDSLLRLNLLLGLEERFGIAVQPEDVELLTSVRSTAALVRDRR